MAIAGDDEQIAVLDRDWARAAAPGSDNRGVWRSPLGDHTGAGPLGGLVLALFEGSSADAELARLANQMITSRAETARWLVDTMITKRARSGTDAPGARQSAPCGS